MSEVRLYRFFNINVGKRGEPWAMCDKHKRDYRPPHSCVVEHLADKTDWPCGWCEDEIDAALGEVDDPRELL